MTSHKIIFRTMFPTSDINCAEWGDVFEFDIQAKTFKFALGKALRFVGARRDEVVLCDVATFDEPALRADILARAEAELDRKANVFAAVAQMEDDFYGMHAERARHP